MTNIDDMREIADEIDERDELTGTAATYKEAEFEGEIFLSTDGKQTVHVKASTPTGRTAAGMWAMKSYKWILAELGSKADMWKETMNGKTEPKGPLCEIHKVPLVHKQGISKKTGRPYDFWSCPERNPDGSYCKYQPKEVEYAGY